MTTEIVALEITPSLTTLTLSGLEVSQYYTLNWLPVMTTNTKCTINCCINWAHRERAFQQDEKPWQRKGRRKSHFSWLRNKDKVQKYFLTSNRKQNFLLYGGTVCWCWCIFHFNKNISSFISSVSYVHFPYNFKCNCLYVCYNEDEEKIYSFLN